MLKSPFALLHHLKVHNFKNWADLCIGTPSNPWRCCTAFSCDSWVFALLLLYTSLARSLHWVWRQYLYFSLSLGADSIYGLVIKVNVTQKLCQVHARIFLAASFFGTVYNYNPLQGFPAYTQLVAKFMVCPYLGNLLDLWSQLLLQLLQYTAGD